MPNLHLFASEQNGQKNIPEKIDNLRGKEGKNPLGENPSPNFAIKKLPIIGSLIKFGPGDSAKIKMRTIEHFYERATLEVASRWERY